MTLLLDILKLTGTRAVATALVLGGLGWLVVLFSIQPKISEQKIIERNLKALETEIEAKFAAFPDFKALRARLQKEEFYLGRMKTKIAAFGDQMLKQTAVTDVFGPQAAISESRSTQLNDYLRRDLTLRGRMRFEEIVERMDQMEKQTPFLKIHSFDIEQKARPQESRTLWKLKLETMLPASNPQIQ